MKKLIISVGLIYSFAYCSNITPYISYLNYDKNTNKDNASIIGIYLSSFKSPYKTEIDAEYMKLKYKDTPDYKQTDLTLAFHYFKGNNYKYKVGIHNIFSSNPETITKYQPGNMWRPSTTTTTTKYNNSYDFVLFGGFMYYQYLKFNANMDFYYSNYENLNVYQISPSYGFNFGNYYSKIGSFYVEGKVNFIKLSKSDAAPRDNYVNFDFKLQNFKGPWVTTLKASLGKNAYKVSDGGFVVYNLGDEYKYNYSFGISKKINTNDSVSFKIGYDVFEETQGYEASSTSFLINYTHNF
ncbi:hypothetical protein [Nautilia lithotrophica]